ncbi:extracellular solute-binding protein [Paenibacillus cymbidii]|uniref:extracellular solute-binding protein n=1 Tax=Paenibacillus cymbidii TaxID=1639034 RepID=UPI001080D326|nr:extracellular solute-binding protein [Paenibacillus cymbidii]
MSSRSWGRFGTVAAAVGLSLSLIASGCSSGGKDNTSKDKGSSATPASSGSPSIAASKQPEERLKMSLFMANSGLQIPNGIDQNDNPFINIIKDYANVDLKVEVPSWQDFKTKLALLLSSGDLPDVLHSPYSADVLPAADQGAFLDLKKYYDKSPIIQKYITPEMMEMAKSPSGHYYRIPMSQVERPQGRGLVVRYDLVQKYNGGKWPESIDEWVKLMRAIHQADPSATVLSNRVVGDYGLTYGGIAIFWLYGAQPYNVRVQDGKVLNTFVLPEYRAAVSLMKQLYNEGILDKEFATNDANKWNDNFLNKNVLMWTDNADQIFGTAQTRKAGKESPNTTTQTLLFAPPLKTFPTELKNPKYAEPQLSVPINDHGLYISSKSKNPDRAWKIIEGFASDQLREAIFWGKQGETYTVQNNVRTPIADKLADPNRSWSLQLALVRGFADGQDVKKGTNDQLLGADYSKQQYDSVNALAEQAKKNGVPFSSMAKLSDDASKKQAETIRFITEATVQAIMGKITMEQFDEKVKQFNTTYGFIYDEYTKYLKDHKDELLKIGIKDAGW